MIETIAVLPCYTPCTLILDNSHSIYCFFQRMGRELNLPLHIEDIREVWKQVKTCSYEGSNKYIEIPVYSRNGYYGNLKTAYRTVRMEKKFFLKFQVHSKYTKNF